MSKLCYGCMKMKNNSPVCEHCGYNENVPNYPHQLPIGTVLKDQYIVGKVLGQGGFGITYIGWDQYLETPVAIKEFYPNAYVSRECSVTQNVTCIADTVKDTFQHNRSRFLREARVLAKLSNVPGIVRVHNLFSENSTAYIIMEYVEGIDLKRYLRMRGQTLTVEEMLHVMQPVMKALMQIHKVELVHRDISPDNIMIQPDGTAKLLDFGAAREVVDADQGKEMPQSTEAILKHGFAPIEQYRRRGSLGPWTDVYSLCATIYYCLAGKVPADAPERVMGDDNVNWAQIPGLTDQQRAALEQGMAMLPEKRIASVQELYQALYSRTATEYSTSRSQVRSEAQPKPEPKPEPQPEPKPEPEPVVKDYPVGTLALEEEPEIPETPKEEPKVKPAKEPEVVKAQEPVKVEQPKTEPVKAEKQEEKPVSKKSPLDSLKSWYVLNILPKVKYQRKTLLIFGVALVLLLVVGYFAIHIWTEPGCTESAKCIFCGKTQGAAAGHSWKDATCTEPKICSRCNLVSGSALGHKWKAATCTEAKKCTRCGTTTGTAAGHKWKAATCTTAKHCTVCNKGEGSALGHDWMEATYERPQTCKRCNATSGNVKGYIDKIYGDGTGETFWRTRSSAYVLGLDKPVVDCYKFTLNYELVEIKKGNPYGNYELFARYQGGEWFSLGVFNIKEDISQIPYTFDKPVSFDCLSVICQVAGSCSIITDYHIYDVYTYVDDSQPAVTPSVKDTSTPTYASDAWKKNLIDYAPLGRIPGIEKKDILSVTFLDTTKDAPADSTDVSRYDSTGTVLAWKEKNGNYYDVYIAADGGINAKEFYTSFLFYECTNLKSVYFNNCFHTEEATDMAGMFNDCNSLIDVDLSSLDTSNVTSMRFMFDGCSSLTNLDLSHFDTSNVTDMSFMFDYCPKIKNLEIHNWDISNVTDYSYFMDDGGTINGRPWEEFFK